MSSDGKRQMISQFAEVFFFILDMTNWKQESSRSQNAARLK